MAFAILGLLFINRLSVNLNPSYAYPSFTVATSYANASPERVEQEITRKVEALISTMDGIKEITSQSRRSSSNVSVELQSATDLQYFRFELASRIRSLYRDMPKEVSYPQIIMNKPNEDEPLSQILSYSLYANDSRESIYRYALDEFSPALSGIDGIYKIEVSGGAKKEIQIAYDVTQLNALGIEKLSVEQAIVDGLNATSLGAAQIADSRLPLVHAESSMEEIMAYPIRARGDHQVKISDICTTKSIEEKANNIFRINGLNNIRISFIPTTEANHLVLAQNIKQAINDIPLPKGYQLLKEYDTTEFIQKELNKNKRRALWSVVLLLLFVLIIYRSWQPIAILVCGVAFNLGISTLLFYWFKVQLNLYAIAAVTVSFGMVIDNLIVMYHHYEKYKDKSVFPAIISATLTTLAGLVVIFYLPDFWRWSLQDFGKVMLIALSVSMVVAFLFVPAAMETLGFNNKVIDDRLQSKEVRVNKLYYEWICWVNGHKKLAFAFLILLFGLPMHNLPSKIEGWSWYNKTIGSDWYIDHLRLPLEKVFGGTLRLFSQNVYNRASFRDVQETKLFIIANMPIGTTLDQIDLLFKKIETYLGQFSNDIKHYTTNIYDVQNGRIEITFYDKNNSNFPYFLENKIKSLAIDLGDVSWRIYGVGKGFSNEGGTSLPQYRVKLVGYNAEKLDKLCNDFAALLEEHPRIEKVDRNANYNFNDSKQEQVMLQIDRNLTSDNNIKPSQLISALNTQNQYKNAIAYTKENIAIRIVEKDISNRDIWNLKNTLIGNNDEKFDFSKVGRFSREQLPSTLYKANQQYIRQLEWEYIGSKKFGNQYLKQCLEKIKPNVPLGFVIENNGFGNWFKNSDNQYLLILLILAIIFVITTIHFESLIKGFQILCIIPISFVGIFLTFYLFDLPFDQGGYTSFLLTSGLVVNSVIFVFSDYIKYRSTNPSNDFIIDYYKAFNHTVTPIALTILSTILGMIPFLIDGKGEVFWFALAAGTIGGLVFSFLFLIAFLPAFISRK
jgi:multidrug efflux pump subunit AcrB